MNEVRVIFECEYETLKNKKMLSLLYVWESFVVILIFNYYFIAWFYFGEGTRNSSTH